MEGSSTSASIWPARAGDPDCTVDGAACQPGPHVRIPFCDACSRAIVEQAVLDLVGYRGGSHGDPGSSISILVSLIAEAEGWLPELVADARDHGYSWSQIAERLAITVSAARHRYAAYSVWRRHHPSALTDDEAIPY